MKATLSHAVRVFSGGVLVAIMFSTAMNTYYYFFHDNIVKFTFTEIYGAEKGWLWEPELLRSIDESLIVDFMNEVKEEDAVKEELAAVNFTYRPTDNCIAKSTINHPSVYIFCNHISTRFPSWAQSFDAVILQDAYLATLEEFRQGLSPVHIGVFEAYHVNRSDYFESEKNSKHVCTKAALAQENTNTTRRKLFTHEFGLLRSVDCSSHEFPSTGCQAIRSGSAYELVSGGFVTQYEVYVDEEGTEYISSPWSESLLLGYETEQDVRWPVEDCLYVRSDQQMGWNGLGYSDFRVTIPASPIFAKLQLSVVVLLLWIVDRGWNLTKFFHSFIKSSRLGIFLLVVVQMVVNATSDIDVLRTIFSWRSASIEYYALLLYVMLSLALLVTLMAVSIVRLYGGVWICKTGNLAAVLCFPITIIVLYIIASQYYDRYTLDNGMQSRAFLDCPGNYDGCTSRAHINILYSVLILVPIPAIMDYANCCITSRINEAMKSTWNRPTFAMSVYPITDSQKQSAAFRNLTSFEKHCLQMEKCEIVIPDIGNPYKSRRAAHTCRDIQLIRPEVIHSAGYSIIYGRFLCRARDLYLLALKQFFPNPLFRNQSMIIWPLRKESKATQFEDGTETLFYVASPIRIYLRDIHDFKTDEAKSLIKGQNLHLR